MSLAIQPFALDTPTPAPSRLGLLNGFDLHIDGTAVAVPLSAQRLLVFLALHRRHPLLRTHIAGTLWADTNDDKASANLRTAVWRIERLGHHLLDATRTHLQLAMSVAVDVTGAAEIARDLCNPATPTEPVEPNLHLTFCAGDLLPDWDEDDWLLMERIRFHQLRLHALERLSQLLVEQGRIVEAIDAALAAVTIDPLRESAHRALIVAYLAEGNKVEAIHQYDRFRRLLADEMGTVPTRQMETTMAEAW